MFEIIKTETFDRWLISLKDKATQMRIMARIRRASAGNFGDMKPLREGIFELRIDHGPGYRVYCVRSGYLVIVLLCGGDKRTQTADIERAIAMAKDWRN